MIVKSVKKWSTDGTDYFMGKITVYEHSIKIFVNSSGIIRLSYDDASYDCNMLETDLNITEAFNNMSFSGKHNS